MSGSKHGRRDAEGKKGGGRSVQCYEGRRQVLLGPRLSSLIHSLSLLHSFNSFIHSLHELFMFKHVLVSQAALFSCFCLYHMCRYKCIQHHCYLPNHFFIVSLGIQLYAGQQFPKVSVNRARFRNSLYRVNFLEARVMQQAQASRSKVSVENINHVPRLVSNSSFLCVLYRRAF